MDLFALPSLYEGLGIVAVEAQAGGVPVLASTEVPDEACVIPEIVERMPLDAGAERWSRRMASLLGRPRPDGEACARRVAESRFGIRRCLDELLPVYRDAVAARR